MFDFSAFPTLMTDRLILREFQVDDAADLFAFRSDPEEQKFNSQPMKDLDESVTLIDEIRQAYARKCAVHWAVAVAETGRVIGLFGFGAWERYHRRAEVGYDLAADYWGRGLATEALVAILSFGFQEMQLNRVEAQTIVDNLASVRLLLRLGFRQEGVRREYSLEEDGAFHDSAIYGLLRGDHPEAWRLSSSAQSSFRSPARRTVAAYSATSSAAEAGGRALPPKLPPGRCGTASSSWGYAPSPLHATRTT